MTWVLDFADDIASDLSRFHGIRNALEIPGVEYLALAERLFAYGGVMTLLASARPQAPVPQPDPHLLDPAFTRVPGTKEALKNSRLTGLFDFGEDRTEAVGNG